MDFNEYSGTALSRFAKLDTNNDGQLTAKELGGGRPQGAGGGGQGTGGSGRHGGHHRGGGGGPPPGQ